MERLTERDHHGDVYVKQHDYITASERLAEYEDLEEQGLLLKLPCKVGDTVWELCKCDDGIYRIFPMKITSVVPYGSPLNQKGRDTDIWNIYAISDYTDVYKSFYDIGKTVFLTKEEAERQIQLEALRYVTTDIDDLL